MYTVGTAKTQTSPNTKGGSNKKPDKKSKGCDTKEDSEDTKKGDYAKALRDLKLEWFKYIRCHWCWCMHT